MAEPHIDEAVKAAEATAHGAHPNQQVATQSTEVSGLERVTLGAISAGWKMPLVYALMSSSAIYAAYALPAALGVGAAFFSLNYFGLKIPFIGDTYHQVKTLALNSFSYAKNYLIATAEFLQNLVTFPKAVLAGVRAGGQGAAQPTPPAPPHA